MKLEIKNQHITIVKREPLVSGTVNVYTAEFSFDGAWDGYTPVAVFESAGVSREAVIADGKCTVPWETLLPNGYLRVGVYGVNGDKRLPTIYTDRLFVARGTEGAEQAAEPTPGAIEQILAQTAADRTAAETAADRAENAALNPPKLSENQTWMIWNPETGQYEDTGVYSGGEAPAIGANGNWFIGGKDTGVAATGPAGLTPHIGENGNWYIGEADTGVKAAGSDGATPTIGANGNWYIGTVDTGVKAAGSDGKTPTIGANGNWWIEDTDTGIAAEGKAATIEIVGTETLEAGQEAAVEEAEGSTAQARKYKFKVPQGKDGDPGATPQRGVDYWTPEDQQAIVDDVLAALPTWEGGSY